MGKFTKMKYSASVLWESVPLMLKQLEGQNNLRNFTKQTRLISSQSN